MKFLRILGISIKRGTVTVKYPFEQPLVTPEFRGRIEIDPAKCVGCGACVLICPPNALTMNREGKSVILRYFVGRCIFCAMCADVCPQQAINVTKDFELATSNVLDLYTDIEHDAAVCVSCGAPYLTKKLVENVSNNLSVRSNRWSLCPECRRKETVRRIASRITGVPR